MDSLAAEYLGETTISFSDVAGKGASQLTFNQVALEEAAPYAAEDADITLRLHQRLWPQLVTHPTLETVFNDIELPLLPVLSRIERNGALVDGTLLFQQSNELAERLGELETQAWDMAGQQFNLASPKQLGEILFEKLEIPVLKKTAKGAPSTKEEVLQELALDYPLPKVLLEHRGLAKLKSTYTDKLPTMINPVSKRIHTSYHQAGTATGRHPVNVSVKGPCHEQEGNDKKCQLEMLNEVGDNILNNDDYTSGASDLDLTDRSSEDEDGIKGGRVGRIVKNFEKMRRV